MLKPTVQLRLGQQLTMTPQLQQAIKLLQLSTLELQGQIQQALEENPMLELAEGEEAEAGAIDEAVSTQSPEPADPEAAVAGSNANDDTGDGDSAMSGDERAAGESTDEIPQDLAVDSSWDEIYDIAPVHTGTPEVDGRDLFENQSDGEETLRDHLMWQLDLAPLTDQDRLIATAIIDAVDEDGFLPAAEGEAFVANLAAALEIEVAEVEAVRRWVQQLDPIGCGSLQVGEVLAIQLHALPADTPWLTAATRLVEDYLDLLGNRDYKGLMRNLQLERDELQNVLALIQGLNPRPGAMFAQASTSYVIPDVFVVKREGRWHVELNPETAPPLRINQQYAAMIKRADQSADNTYLRNNLQEARWFIKSLLSRNETLLRVAAAIVDRQRAFLDYGPEAMKPLVLRDIADQLELHESTISRVTSQKYMHTPRGVYELKYFFSSHVSTTDGGECSATAIRAMIRKLVDEEDSNKPLSDNKIAAILMERGINVARRTVAKYREALQIPSSNERKRLA